MAQGDCFPKAVQVLDELLADDLDAYLVHGLPVYLGDGEPDGPDGRFHHAWVEVDHGDWVEVHDLSNDREVRMDRDLYYAVGNVTPEEHTTEFDRASASWQMVEFGHPQSTPMESTN